MSGVRREGIMIKSFRFSIAGLMGVVLIIAALGLAAMRLASELLAGIMFLLTSGVLCLAFIALICRGPAERAWWLGFNVFGWVYDRFAFRAWGEIRLAADDSTARAARDDGRVRGRSVETAAERRPVASVPHGRAMSFHVTGGRNWWARCRRSLWRTVGQVNRQTQ